MVNPAQSTRSALLWLVSAPDGALPATLELSAPGSPLNVALQWANIIALAVLAFIFFPTITRDGDSPFVATADEKLDALFGTDGGCLLPAAGGVLGPADPAVSAQHLVDLGSGNGAVIRAATRVGGFGRASGYEINAGLVLASRLLSLGRANEVVYAASLWEASLADADVVVVYALPKFLSRLGEKLTSELRHDAIVVSNRWPFSPQETPGLRLVREVKVETSLLSPDLSGSLYLYRVCAGDGGDGAAG